MTTTAFTRLEAIANRHAAKPVPASIIDDANSMAFDMRGPRPRQGEAIRLPAVCATMAKKNLQHLAAYLLLAREKPAHDLANEAETLAILEQVRGLCDVIEDQLNACREDRFDLQDKKQVVA